MTEAAATSESRFEDWLSRHVEAMTGRPPGTERLSVSLVPTPNITFPLTTEVVEIALTVEVARALLVLVHAARVTVRTRGGGALADALARLDEASPR